MVRLIGAAAHLLGLFVRWSWLASPALLRLGAIALVSYGVWLFDERLSYIVMGVVAFVLTPRTGRRKT